RLLLGGGGGHPRGDAAGGLGGGLGGGGRGGRGLGAAAGGQGEKQAGRRQAAHARKNSRFHGAGRTSGNAVAAQARRSVAQPGREAWDSPPRVRPTHRRRWCSPRRGRYAATRPSEATLALPVPSRRAAAALAFLIALG